MVRSLFGLLSLVLLVSCQPNQALNVSPVSNTGIINGREVPATDPIAQNVVAIWDAKDKAMCTASLLPGNVVLTAAHCLIDARPNQLFVIFSTDPFDVLSSREPDVIKDSVRKVVALQYNPDYKTAQDEKRDKDQSDIGVLRFEGTVPGGYKPAELLTDAAAIAVGVDVIMAGYGVSSVKVKDIDVKGTPKEELEKRAELGEILCDEHYTECIQIDMDGDGILRAAHAPIAEVTDSEVVLDETKQGTCSGDSGGPVYLRQHGVNYLFALTSRGDMTCDQEGVYTNILAHKEWLKEAITKLLP